MQLAVFRGRFTQREIAMAKRRRRRSTAGCAGLKGKGQLKKGYKWKRGSACPVRAKSR